MLPRPYARTRANVRSSRSRLVQAWLGSSLALAAGSCASNPSADEGSLSVSDPPAEQAVVAGAQSVYKAAKMTGNPFVSPVKRAQPIAQGDWVVCLRSDDPEWPRTMTLLFSGAKLVAFRGAVAIDGCANETYAPTVKPVP
jgi:hypothetical protein